MTSRASTEERRVADVESAQRGDAGAFGRLVEAYHAAAIAYAASLLRDYDLADDAAQEAFVVVHRELPALRDPKAFPAWLRKVVFTQADRLMRRREFQRATVAETTAQASHDPSPAERLEKVERAAAVHTAIAKLPEAERQVVLMFYLADRSHAAIARFLGITPNAVKTRLYAARRKLRVALEQLVEDAARAEYLKRKRGSLQRVLTASLPLEVYHISENGERSLAGGTVAGRAAELPDASSWCIEPTRLLSGAEWNGILELIRSMRIPGLVGAGQLNDALLERIARLGHVTYLDCSQSVALSDDGIRVLSAMPQLEHLNLTNTGVTDAGFGGAPNPDAPALIHAQSQSGHQRPWNGVPRAVQRIALRGPQGDVGR